MFSYGDIFNYADKPKDPSRMGGLPIIPSFKMTNNRKKVLGEGPNAIVYEEFLQDDCKGKDNVVAAKVLHMDEKRHATDDDGGGDAVGCNAAIMDHVAEQEQLIDGISHPNIIRIKGVRLWPLSLVMELCSNNSLYKCLKWKKLEGWAKRIWILIGIANGMAFLHSKSILHQDLKTPNILLKEDYTPRIADFGRARAKPMKEDQHRNGTWMAPEVVVEGQEPTTKSDVFSFAIIMWEVLTGQKPWGGISPHQVFFQLMKKERPTLPEDKDIPSNCYGWESYVNLMRTCWSEDPSQRPEFAEISIVLSQILKKAQEAEESGSPTPAAEELEGVHAADPSLGVEDDSIEVPCSNPGCLPRLLHALIPRRFQRPIMSPSRPEHSRKARKHPLSWLMRSSRGPSTAPAPQVEMASPGLVRTEH